MGEVPGGALPIGLVYGLRRVFQRKRTLNKTNTSK
jgi:hypothetical protein